MILRKKSAVKPVTSQVLVRMVSFWTTGGLACELLVLGKMTWPGYNVFLAAWENHECCYPPLSPNDGDLVHHWFMTTSSMSWVFISTPAWKETQWTKVCFRCWCWWCNQQTQCPLPWIRYSSHRPILLEVQWSVVFTVLTEVDLVAV